MTTLRMVALADLWPSRWQPRETFDPEELMELAQSIRELGLINPVTVFKRDGTGWELVAGERRSRAVAALALAERSHNLGWWVGKLAAYGLQEPMIKAQLRHAKAKIQARVEELDLERLHMIAAMENIERRNLTPLEEAKALAGLLAEFGWTQAEMAERLGRSQGWVSQRLALLELPQTARRALQVGRLMLSHGRAIAAVPEPVREEFATWLIGADGEEAVGAQKAQRMAEIVRQLLDPRYWREEEGQVYRPMIHNLLQMMAWLVTNRPVKLRPLMADLMVIGGLERLGNGPEAVDSWRLGSLLMHGWEKTREEAWEEFAAATQRDCTHCRWREMGPKAQPFVGCRPRDAEAETCMAFCGPEDPVVIPVSEMLWKRAEEETRGQASWGLYLTSGAALETALGAVEATEGEKESEQQALERRRGAWQFLWQWQERAGDHFFSQQCEDCALFSETTRCKLLGTMAEPVPIFGLLVREDGLVAPRCTGFRLRGLKLKRIASVPGMQLGDRGMVLAWLREIVRFGGGLTHPLAWLPIVRPATGAPKWTEIEAWFRRNWDSLGDGRVAALLTAAAAESSARGDGIKELYDPTHDRYERWLPAYKWNLAEDRREKWWPKGWPKPWEET